VENNLMDNSLHVSVNGWPWLILNVKLLDKIPNEELWHRMKETPIEQQRKEKKMALDWPHIT
jgi:hypothetical protein